MNAALGVTLFVVGTPVTTVRIGAVATVGDGGTRTAKSVIIHAVIDNNVVDTNERVMGRQQCGAHQ